MNRFLNWCSDLSTAYVGGLAAGAPAGLVLLWFTGSEASLTAATLVAMAGLFVWRRRIRRTRAIRGARIGFTAD